MNKRLKYFSLIDYILIAMLASMGIAIKTIIVPLAQIITGPLFIPGGVVAGGFYMSFLVLGVAITQKYGTATLIAITQGVVVAITGTMGSHGAVSILTYAFPGIALDIFYMISRHKSCCPICAFIGGAIANIAGSFAVNLAIFNLPFVPLMLSLSAASLSGGLGGLIAYAIGTNLRELEIISGKKGRENNKKAKNKDSKNGKFASFPDDVDDFDE